MSPKLVQHLGRLIDPPSRVIADIEIMLGPIIHPPLPPWNHILLLQVPNLLLRLPYLLEITRMLLLIDIIRVFVETELST